MAKFVICGQPENLRLRACADRVEEETKTLFERESQSKSVSNHSFESFEETEPKIEEKRKMFLSAQDEKIGTLEDPIAFTEEDFLRPKFARDRSHRHRGHGGGGQTHHERTQSSLNNATTCSILSLEDSALDATLGAEEAEALAARGRMYERNTDLMGEEEEVDPGMPPGPPLLGRNWAAQFALLQDPDGGPEGNSNAQNMIKEVIKTFKNFSAEGDPANNCLDVAIITDPKFRTKKTINKLKYIAGRVLKK